MGLYVFIRFFKRFLGCAYNLGVLVVKNCNTLYINGLKI